MHGDTNLTNSSCCGVSATVCRVYSGMKGGFSLYDSPLSTVCSLANKNTDSVAGFCSVVAVFDPVLL